MKITLLFIALVFSLTAFGQVVFEKGYIITSDGLKHECLIKNKDWYNNPQVIDYKLTTDGEVMQGSILNIQEFKVEGYSKYIKAAVDIDRSSRATGSLSNHSAPDFERDELFLEVIVEGPASLYIYRGKSVERFFFSTKDTPITQLIYKQYLVNNTSVRENKDYLAQLRSNVYCASSLGVKIQELEYDRKKLESYFNEMNACNGGIVLAKSRKKGRGQFHLYVMPGINYSTMTVDHLGYSRDAEYADQVTFRMGIEAEFVFGFNKNKWAFIIEPSYHYYKDETETRSVDLAYVEFPFGLRHYFHLNNSSLFINAMFMPWKDIWVKDHIGTGVQGNEFNIDVVPSFAIGAGLKKGRFKTEVRAYGKNDLLAFYDTYSTDYFRYDWILAFRLK